MPTKPTEKAILREDNLKRRAGRCVLPEGFIFDCSALAKDGQRLFTRGRFGLFKFITKVGLFGVEEKGRFEVNNKLGFPINAQKWEDVLVC